MKPAVVNGRWTVQMTDAQADWDVWAVWEKERFASMAEHLHRGDVLFDVGAEFGSISAVYAQMVGGDRVVLFEPEPRVWPGIRMTWEANGLPTPAGCYVGLVGNVDDPQPPDLDFDATPSDGWPACAWSDTVQDAASYRYLFDHANSTPTIRLDTWVEQHGVVPDAITIDVEGAELEVLAGAERLWRGVRPLVWCSVHPDLMLRDFATDDGLAAVRRYLDRWDYESEVLAVDHEIHILARPG